MDATLEKLLKVILKEGEKKTSVAQLFVATLNIRSWNKHPHIYLQCIEGPLRFRCGIILCYRSSGFSIRMTHKPEKKKREILRTFWSVSFVIIVAFVCVAA